MNDENQNQGDRQYANYYNIGNANTQNANTQNPNYAQMPMPNQPNYPMQPQYGQRTNYPMQQGFQQPQYAPSNGKPFDSNAFWDSVNEAPRTKDRFRWKNRVDKNNQPFGIATIRLPADIRSATYWVNYQGGGFPAIVVDYGEIDRETNIFTIEKKVSLSMGGKNMARAVKNRDGQTITMTQYGQGREYRINVVEVHEVSEIVDLTRE